jgi:hypothetical protein
MKSRTLNTITAAVLAAFATGAQASERAELEALRDTTLNLIRALVDQGLLPRDRAEALIRDAEARSKAARASTDAAAAAGAPAGAAAGAAGARADDPKVVRVPYVPQTVRDEIRAQLREEIIARARKERWGVPEALPEWLDTITLEGDVRLRAQSDRFDRSNAAAFQFPPGYFAQGNSANTLVDRDRFQLRGRFGAAARLSPSWSAGVRLSTGSVDSPVSTNQTLGRYFNRSAILLDRAFLRYDNQSWLSITGGRIANPFFAPSETVWAADLSFEGIAASIRPQLTPTFTPFLTVGAFPLEEREASGSDRWLTGAQAGFQWQMTPEIQLRTGAALYDFRNLVGSREAVGAFIAGSPSYGQSQARFRQKGNTVFNIADPNVSFTNPLYGLASEFRVSNVSALLAFTHFEPVTVQLALDWVRNLAYDEGAVQRRTGLLPTQLGPASGNTGFEGRLSVGMTSMRSRGDWQMFGGYRRLGSDAVVDAFNDPSFALGGTNNRGFYLGASYGLDRNVWVTARYLSANEIKGPPLAVDVLQVDLNARF